MFDNVSGNDIAAGISLSVLSFVASVIQGSTSLGDGIVLQITWGILQELVPYATSESRLGSDGMRVITVFMFLRLSIIPPYLLWLLWGAHKKRQRQAIQAQQELKLQHLSDVSSPDGEVTSPSSPASPAPTAAPRIFSGRLFLIIAVPNTIWCILGVFLLQNLQSRQIAVYSGAIFISFSFMYMALKMWKSSPARKNMPQWLQNILSPSFFVEGSDKTLTTHAQISALFFFNLTGIMTTLSGIGGPPMMIFILLYEIPMHLTRFMFPIGTLIGAFIRLVVSLYSGVMPLEHWPFFLPGLVFGLIGIRVGMLIGNVLSPSMYSATIFCLLILAGIVMLTSNLFVTGPALLIAIGALTFKFFFWDPKHEAPLTPTPAPLKDVLPITDASVGRNNRGNTPKDIPEISCMRIDEDLNRISKKHENEIIEALF